MEFFSVSQLVSPGSKHRMKNHIIIVFLDQISYLLKFLFLSYSSECSHPLRLQDPLNCNITRKSLVIGLALYMELDIDGSLRLTLSFFWVWLGMSRYSQSVAKKHCQYLWKEMSGCLYFFCIKSNVSGNYESIMTLLLGVVRHVLTCPKFSQIKNCLYLWKKVSDCLDIFCTV